jgi:hypothetical protein
MTNQASNAIIAKSMGTMDLNDGISKHISTQAEQLSQIMKEKPHMVCFSHATILKNNTKTYGCSIVDATIT